MTDLARKFGETIRHFAGLGGSRDITSLLLLNELVNSKDGFLSLPILKDRKPELMHNIERFVNEEWMNKLFREYPTSTNHFFFDRLVQALVIDDPQLAFYLKKLHFSTLAREVGKRDR